MEIVFSRHAKRQMKWRQITEEEVKLALTSYDTIEDSMRGRRSAIKKVGARSIKVTFRQEDDRMTVITALERG